MSDSSEIRPIDEYDRLLYVLSHDLRTPARAVRQYVYLLQDVCRSLVTHGFRRIYLLLANVESEYAMHIVAKKPVALTREDVPAELIAKEREIAKEQAEAQGKGKPANIIEKISEGKVNSWLKENVLIEQPFVKDPGKTVGQLVKSAGLELKKFVRYKVGEASS